MHDDRLLECRLTRLRWTQQTTLVVVEVVTAGGLTGLGEATMSGDDTAVAGATRALFSRALRDRAVRDIPSLVDGLAAEAATARAFVAATAASSLEQALWDIRGQHLGLPIAELLGGYRRPSVRLYANINRVKGPRTPEAFAEQAAAAVAAGFDTVKCAPFDEVLPSDDNDDGLAPGLARLAAVRDVVGERTGVIADCHGRLGVRRALALTPEFERLRLKWLEEPVVTNVQMWRVVNRRSPSVPARGPVDLAGLAEVGRRGQFPLASGEFETSLAAFLGLMATGALAFVMPDVKHCGGLSVAAAVAAVAASLGVLVSPHNPSGPIGTLASAHVASVAASFDSLEIAWGELYPVNVELLTPALDIGLGHLTVPTSPGLGAHLIPETVERLSIPFDAEVSA